MELEDHSRVLCLECGGELKTQYLGENLVKYCRSCGRMTTSGHRQKPIRARRRYL